MAQADLVRRAMGKKKLDVMIKEREKFIHGQVDEKGNVLTPGCERNGIDAKSADKIFDEMVEFAKYAFNKSHAAAYAVIAYQTAYLKTYYAPEFMAATLNSFLGNLDKIPEYIDECKRLGIKILPPNINKSYTRFTVETKNSRDAVGAGFHARPSKTDANPKQTSPIRFGLGSVKNVGVAVVDVIVRERNAKGSFKNFIDFLERMSGEAVNRKCIESLIKAGAFDEFNQTRATLVKSFESILDTINNTEKKEIKGQVNLFDVPMGDTANLNPEQKYKFTEMPEYTERELLSMEKEMLGIYISGHPLDKMRDEIKKKSNIDAAEMLKIKEENRMNEDGRQVKYAGIITSVKKKYTRNNTLMAFVTVEDLYRFV